MSDGFRVAPKERSAWNDKRIRAGSFTGSSCHSMNVTSWHELSVPRATAGAVRVAPSRVPRLRAQSLPSRIATRSFSVKTRIPADDPTARQTLTRQNRHCSTSRAASNVNSPLRNRSSLPQCASRAGTRLVRNSTKNASSIISTLPFASTYRKTSSASPVTMN